jgi:hypothetical protein
MIATHVCNTFTLLSIVQNSKRDDTSVLAKLPLDSLEQCLLCLVNDSMFSSGPASQGPNSPSIVGSFTSVEELFLQGVNKCSFTRAACLCDCVFMYHELECRIARRPCLLFQFDCSSSTQQLGDTGSWQILFDAWRVSREHLDRLDLELLWSLNFAEIYRAKKNNSAQPQEISLGTLISTNKYAEALRQICDNKRFRHELLPCIPLLLKKVKNSKSYFQNSWDDEDEFLLGRLKCTLKVIQIVFQHPVCLKELLEPSGERISVAKEAQLALVNLTLHVGVFIREHFSQKSMRGDAHPISAKQPQFVQYWFQILSMLCASSDLFYRSDICDSNLDMAWSDPVNISFATLKLLELIESCAIPLVSMPGTSSDAPDSDIKKCMLAHLGASPSQIADDGCCESKPKLSLESKNSMSRIILRELGRLAQHPLAKGSTYLAQVEEYQFILSELIAMTKDESKEASARARILRKVHVWNVSSDARGCSVYCACLGLMLFGRESSVHMFARRSALERLKQLLEVFEKQSPDDKSTSIVKMFVSELAVLICLSSCCSEIDPFRQSVAISEQLNGSLVPVAAAEDRDYERSTLSAICTELCTSMRCYSANRVKAAAEAFKSKPCLEKAQKVIMSMFTDKADGQLVDEFGKYRQPAKNGLEQAQLGEDGSCKRKVDRFFKIGNDGWIDQDAFLEAWNEELRLQLRRNLIAFLDTIKQQNEYIFDALIGAANRAGIVDVAHLHELANAGALEPGHEKSKWILDAYTEAEGKLRLGIRCVDYFLLSSEIPVIMSQSPYW